MNYTVLLIVAFVGMIIGYKIPSDYLWLGMLISFAFTFTMVMLWPDHWDVFK